MLFGHVRGAFTGATTNKEGCFDLAHDGTVFLDEIGDMPLSIQIKLLRVLDDGMIVPVGKTTEHHVNVRVIAATNADLEEKIEAGTFRSDLFYRLTGFTISVKPLKERTEDIPLLAQHFARTLSSEMGFPCPELGPKILASLKKYNFPGNVRELRNMIERGLIESEGRKITLDHLHFLEIPSLASNKDRGHASNHDNKTTALPLNLEETEGLLIKRAMETTSGNISAAARLLGINRTKLYRKLSALQE